MHIFPISPPFTLLLIPVHDTQCVYCILSSCNSVETVEQEYKIRLLQTVTSQVYYDSMTNLCELNIKSSKRHDESPRSNAFTFAHFKVMTFKKNSRRSFKKN